MASTHAGIQARLLALAGLAFVVGCSADRLPSISGGAVTEENEINSIIGDEDSDYFTDDLFSFEDGPLAVAGNAMGASLAPIEADRWRRVVVLRESHVEHEFPDRQTALVTYSIGLSGDLKIFDANVDSLGNDSLYVKDFANRIARQALFERHGEGDARWPRRRWHLSAVSFGVATSVPEPTVGIQSVSITNVESGFTRTYTDPTALLDVATEIPVFEPGEFVEVSVEVTGEPVLAFLHSDGHRIPLENQGGGTWSGEYRVPMRPGPHHAVVDVLAEGTLLDSEGAYDNVAWGTLYRVAGDDEPVADAAE